jgi:hypothetical protein
MEELKLQLNKHNWSIEVLYGPVKAQLFKTLKIEESDETSLTYLTSKFYSPGRIESQLSAKKVSKLKVFPLESNSANYIGKQIVELYGKGTLLKDPELNVIASEYIKDFISFCETNEKYRVLLTFLENIFLVDEVNFRGASHPHFLGSLFLQIRKADSKFDFLVSAIHETAHQELFLINFVDRLVNSKFDFNMVHAPFQNQLRPPIGRLHSLHALFRMLQFIFIYEPNNPKLEHLVSKFKNSVKSIGSSELTDFGKFLLEDVYESYSNAV